MRTYCAGDRLYQADASRTSLVNSGPSSSVRMHNHHNEDRASEDELRKGPANAGPKESDYAYSIHCKWLFVNSKGVTNV